VLIGIIADTHGYVDPRLDAAFAGVEAIVLAGDVGGMHVLEALQAIAPLHAVYGNNDEKLGQLGLPFRADFELAGVRFHLVHQLPHARPSADTQVVAFGHSHRTIVEQRGDVLYVNPGAAGRAGFHRMQTVALLVAEGGGVRETRIVELGAREVLARRVARRVTGDGVTRGESNAERTNDKRESRRRSAAPD
jgi:putative phosphoesterase